METLQNTSTRLRRTFQYSSDSDDTSPSTPSIMDEDEQETFIARLAEHNLTRNRQFRQLLLALPGIASIPYLIGLFNPSTSLVSLLALSSLAATAYLLLQLPVTKTGIRTLDELEGRWSGLLKVLWKRPGAEGQVDGGAGRTRRRRRRSSMGNRIGLELDGGSTTSPLLTHLPYLNVVLSMVVAVAGYLNHRITTGQYQGTVAALAGLGNLPAIICVVVVVAKMVMAGVDPEKELNELRYEYKGA